jgi:4-alpha-glucanotransferase
MYGGSERDITRGQLDYAAVMRSKMALVRDLYRATGEAVLASPGFSRWFRGARDWLQPYALYCFFRDLQGTADTSAWGTRATLTRAQLHSLTDASQLHYRSIALHYYVQYLCHTQLAAAAAHAARAGVLLSVTLPHGMPRRSADVWAQPSLFRLGHVTGTPPDAADSAGSRSACVPFDWVAPPPPAEEGGMRGSGDSSGGGSSSGGSGSGSGSDGGGAIEWWARRLDC